LDFFTIMSEHQIKKGYENGEFDNLPGFGKPLELEDFSNVPEDLRMAYRLLKNAGYSPEENTLKQELLSIEGLIRNCESPEEKDHLQKKMNEKLHRFNQMMSKRGARTNSSIFKNYSQKIDRKFL
jgi:hypothetical protein